MVENYDALVENGELYITENKVRGYRSALISVERTCGGDFNRPVKARIRELLALGAASYGLTREAPPGGPSSEQAVIDFATFSLWPVITAPKLPRGWLDAFIGITSCVPLASLVVHARSQRGTSDAMSVQEFGQALTQIWFAPGILNLLNDLADPRRGGCALTGIAIASRGYAPRRRASPRRMAKWALLTAIGGIVGNRADDALTMMRDLLIEYSSNPPIHPDNHVGSKPAHPGVAGAQHNDSGRHAGIVHAINSAHLTTHLPYADHGGGHHH